MLMSKEIDFTRLEAVALLLKKTFASEKYKASFVLKEGVARAATALSALPIKDAETIAYSFRFALTERLSTTTPV